MLDVCCGADAASAVSFRCAVAVVREISTLGNVPGKCIPRSLDLPARRTESKRATASNRTDEYTFRHAFAGAFASATMDAADFVELTDEEVIKAPLAFRAAAGVVKGLRMRAARLVARVRVQSCSH